MKTYRLTEAADQHLQAIWRYSRNRWGDARANAYLEAIDAGLKAGLETPTLLRARPDLGEPIVARRVGSHIVYGVMTDETLIVIAVLHGRMDPKRHLLKPSPD